MAEQSAREQFIEKVKNGLDELNAEIDRLEARASELSGEARQKLQQRRDDVKQSRADLEKRLNEARAASEAQFEKLKADADYAWKAFRNSVNYFRSHFK